MGSEQAIGKGERQKESKTWIAGTLGEEQRLTQGLDDARWTQRDVNERRKA